MFKTTSLVDPVFEGSTPLIDNQAISQILDMDIEHLGGPLTGVVRFNNAIGIDQSKMRSWIEENAQKAHEKRWEYKTDDAGVTYAVNEDGNKFSLEQIEEVPIRFLEPVRSDTLVTSPVLRRELMLAIFAIKLILL
jgi:hypothetical protein